MKIAIFPSTFLPIIGGAELATHNLVLQLRAKGHDAQVVTWWGNRTALRAMVPYPVIHLLPRCYAHAYTRIFPRAGCWNWYGALQVMALQMRHRFDVWNVHWAFPAIVMAAPALRRMGVPLLATCHGGDIMINREFLHGHRQDPTINEAILGGLRQSAALSAISPAIRAAYEEAGLGGMRIFDVPNGIDFRRIAQRQTDRAAVRARLGIPDGHRVILTVANYRLQKGLESIPPVVAALAKVRRDFLWLLVGKGCDRIAQAAAAQGLAAHFRVTEVAPAPSGVAGLPTDELIDLYHSADLYVSVSHVEAFPLVLLEAMAAGLPVVARDIAGYRTALRQDVQGFLVQAPPDEGFVAPIDALLRDDGLRHSMSGSGILTAKEYDWSAVADRYLAAYEDLRSERV